MIAKDWMTIMIGRNEEGTKKLSRKISNDKE